MQIWKSHLTAGHKLPLALGLQKSTYYIKHLPIYFTPKAVITLLPSIMLYPRNVLNTKLHTVHFRSSKMSHATQMSTALASVCKVHTG